MAGEDGKVDLGGILSTLMNKVQAKYDQYAKSQNVGGETDPIGALSGLAEKGQAKYDQYLAGGGEAPVGPPASVGPEALDAILGTLYDVGGRKWREAQAGMGSQDGPGPALTKPGEPEPGIFDKLGAWMEQDHAADGRDDIPKQGQSEADFIKQVMAQQQAQAKSYASQGVSGRGISTPEEGSNGAPAPAGTPSKEEPAKEEPKPKPEGESKGGGGDYIVQRGDSLWKIVGNVLGPKATQGEILDATQRLYEANRATIGDDWSLIHPGQRLDTSAIKG